MNNLKKLLILIACIVCLTGCEGLNIGESSNSSSQKETISFEKESDSFFGKWADDSEDFQEEITQITTTEGKITASDVPEFSGEPYVIINENQPEFTKEDLKQDSFENYSELDALGRCGVAYANIGKDLMPTEERGAIGQVKPAGWHTVKYDCVDGKYLYNRCHLIGYQLTGENANERNLITGTRYLNIDGMLPFENLVADYIKKTSNHVLYRVTPIYEGKNLIATGLQMEACSVEDEGADICYNVFVYNSQPGVVIDYATGESWEDDSKEVVKPKDKKQTVSPSKKITYILNTSSKKFHKKDCSSVSKLSGNNKEEYTGTRKELEEKGYEPCKRCNPK